MKEENNIDKYFREELSEQHVAPSDAVWEGINQELGPEDDDVAIVPPWRGIALVLAGLLLLLSGIFCWRTHSLKKEKMALEQQYSTEQALQESRSKEQDLIAINKHSQNQAERAENASATLQNEYYVKIEDRNIKANLESEHQETSSEDISIEDPSITAWNSMNTGRRFNPTTSKAGVEEPNENANKLAAEDYSEHADLALLYYKPINIAGIEHKRPNPIIDSTGQDWLGCAFDNSYWPGWSLGFAGYQNTTFRRISTQNTEGNTQRTQLNNAEKPGSSNGLRAYAAYALGKGWSISGGLEYSQWKQEGGFQFQYAFVDSEIATSGGSIVATIDSELTTSTGVSNVELLSSFDAGALPWSGFEGNSIRTADVRIEESITWLSAPLSLRYESRFNRLGLQGEAGFSYDQIISNSIVTEINSDFDQSSTSEPEYSRNGFISAHAAVGLHYWIRDGLKISAGPRFKSWLVPLYSDESIKTYPYSGALEMGIEFKL